jgi:hypothetical protein
LSANRICNIVRCVLHCPLRCLRAYLAGVKKPACAGCGEFGALD